MKLKIAIVVALALFAASCEKKQQAASGKPRGEKPPVVKGVRLEPVALVALNDYYEATGTVRARTATTLAARMLGTVTALRVREGDRVNTGQVLIEIDNREAAAQLQKAQAGLLEAQEAIAEIEQESNATQAGKSAAEAQKRLAVATLNRYQTLLERRSVSPQEFDEVKARQQIAAAEADRADRLLQTIAAKKQQGLARIEQAKAGLTSAQINAGYARVVAPANGIVTAKHIELGATVTPGAPLLTIEDNTRYRLEANVEEAQLSRIKLRDTARVRIDALGLNDLAATVSEILPTTDPASRTYIVKLDLVGQRGLRSGLYGTARFTSGQQQALTIPSAAIVQRGQLTGVFVVNAQGFAQLRLLKTGRTFGDRVQALSGLNEGERIVIDGLAGVTDGSRVQ
ncbi:MAG: efflux RND transporter periplasmic adaptor subunit [Blastocatellia bacterium]